ncbi:MAG: LysM peptidoglycan-binding domain-containing protein, partial [Clostridiaceae bacterium]|nr:LysM peptidoglycan-binding domain-containing protein [Clostridiaceae bacterium]
VVANIILPEIVKLGFKNRGVKDGSRLFVINRTKMPAILIECAFCDSPKDMGNYDTDKMAEAIFMGVCKAFNVEVPKSDTSAVYYTVVKGDTLWAISRRYNVSLNYIVALNGIKVASVIDIGQKIRIK